MSDVGDFIFSFFFGQDKIGEATRVRQSCWVKGSQGDADQGQTQVTAISGGRKSRLMRVLRSVDGHELCMFVTLVCICLLLGEVGAMPKLLSLGVLNVDKEFRYASLQVAHGSLGY